MAEFKAFWTGAYPNLCSGEWKLYKDGRDVSALIPSEKRNRPMDTHGVYADWDLLTEECNNREDGLYEKDWIAANPWINLVTETPDERSALFLAIAAADWRYGSCGGCI